MRNSKSLSEGIDSAANVRKSVSEILLISIVIAFGVNLFTNVDFSTINGILLFIISIISIFFGVLIILRRAIPRVNRQYTIDCAFVISRTNNQIVRIPRYDFNHSLRQSITGLFFESQAIKDLWDDADFRDIHTYETSEEFLALPVRNKIIIEAIEYYSLKNLSLHLSGYFNSAEASQKIRADKVVTLSRADIPSVLLSNRFLELFTRPMEERDSFQKTKMKDKSLIYITHIAPGETKGTIVSATNSDGAVFERFRLTLPLNTSIVRNPDHSININNQKFQITIKSAFEGWHTNTGQYFDELYLGQGFEELNRYKCSIKISVKFSFFTLMKSSGWEYLYWIESWIHKIKKEADFEEFVGRIGWEQALTNSIIRRNIDKNQKSKTFEQTYTSKSDTD